jgi:ABC-2 type transport system permease protein
MLIMMKTALLLLLRDKGNLFFYLLFPSLLVLILGHALAFLDNADTPIDHIAVEYSVEAADPYSKAAVDTFLAEIGSYDAVTFAPSTGAERSAAKLEDGSIAAYVVFAQAATSEQNGEKGGALSGRESPGAPSGGGSPGELSVEISEGRDVVKNRAVNLMMEGFSVQVGTYSALAEAAAAEAAAEASAAAANLDATAAGAAQQTAPPTATPTTSPTTQTQDLVTTQTAGYNRTMLDYYAVTMIVMILVMGGSIGGAGMLYQRRREGTARRELSTSRNRNLLYLQLLFESLLQNIIQVATVMLSSTLLFGAQYAATWQGNVVLFFSLLCAGMAVSALFLLVGIFVRFNPIAILMPVTWVMLFLSGTFSKEVEVPGIGDYMPASIVQNAAFDLTIFGNMGPSLVVLAVSLCIVAVATIVGAALFNRREMV